MAILSSLLSAIPAFTGMSPVTFFTISAILIAMYYLVSGIVAPSRPSTQQPVHMQPLPMPVQLGDVTEAELKAYDGSDPSKPLLMAIKGKIYDVSQSTAFYGRGGPYALFTGKDASRALAKMSFEEQDLNSNLEGLSQMELDALNDWEWKFMSKYVQVGQVVEKKEKTAQEAMSRDAGSNESHVQTVHGSVKPKDMPAKESIEREADKENLVNEVGNRPLGAGQAKAGGKAIESETCYKVLDVSKDTEDKVEVIRIGDEPRDESLDVSHGQESEVNQAEGHSVEHMTVSNRSIDVSDILAMKAVNVVDSPEDKFVQTEEKTVEDEPPNQANIQKPEANIIQNKPDVQRDEQLDKNINGKSEQPEEKVNENGLHVAADVSDVPESKTKDSEQVSEIQVATSSDVSDVQDCKVSDTDMNKEISNSTIISDTNKAEFTDGGSEITTELSEGRGIEQPILEVKQPEVKLIENDADDQRVEKPQEKLNEHPEEKLHESNVPDVMTYSKTDAPEAELKQPEEKLNNESNPPDIEGEVASKTDAPEAEHKQPEDKLNKSNAPDIEAASKMDGRDSELKKTEVELQTNEPGVQRVKQPEERVDENRIYAAAHVSDAPESKTKDSEQASELVDHAGTAENRSFDSDESNITFQQQHITDAKNDERRETEYPIVEDNRTIENQEPKEQCTGINHVDAEESKTVDSEKKIEHVEEAENNQSIVMKNVEDEENKSIDTEKSSEALQHQSIEMSQESIDAAETRCEEHINKATDNEETGNTQQQHPADMKDDGTTDVAETETLGHDKPSENKTFSSEESHGTSQQSTEIASGVLGKKTDDSGQTLQQQSVSTEVTNDAEAKIEGHDGSNNATETKSLARVEAPESKMLSSDQSHDTLQKCTEIKSDVGEKKTDDSGETVQQRSTASEMNNEAEREFATNNEAPERKTLGSDQSPGALQQPAEIKYDIREKKTDDNGETLQQQSTLSELKTDDNGKGLQPPESKTSDSGATPPEMKTGDSGERLQSTPSEVKTDDRSETSQLQSTPSDVKADSGLALQQDSTTPPEVKTDNSCETLQQQSTPRVVNNDAETKIGGHIIKTVSEEVHETNDNGHQSTENTNGQSKEHGDEKHHSDPNVVREDTDKTTTVTGGSPVSV